MTKRQPIAPKSISVEEYIEKYGEEAIQAIPPHRFISWGGTFYVLTEDHDHEHQD